MYAPTPPHSQGYPPAPAPGAGFSNDPIPRAWKLVTAQLGPWMGSSLIAVGISLFSNRVDSVIEKSGIDPLGIWTFVSLVPYLLVFLLFNAGLTRMALHQIRTGVADFGLIFTVGDVALPIMGAGMLTYLIISVSAIFCLVPGLYFLAMFTFVMPLIVDRRLAAMEAIGLSYRTLSSYSLDALFLYVRLFIVLLAGLLALCVGILVALPIVTVTLTILYCDFFPTESINPPVAPINVPPISDPGV